VIDRGATRWGSLCRSPALARASAPLRRVGDGRGRPARFLEARRERTTQRHGGVSLLVALGGGGSSGGARGLGVSALSASSSSSSSSSCPSALSCSDPLYSACPYVEHCAIFLASGLKEFPSQRRGAFADEEPMRLSPASEHRIADNVSRAGCLF